MVGQFVRLKTRILRNRLRRDSAWGLVMFVLVWVAALGFGLGGGILFAAAARVSEMREIAPIVYSMVFLWWVFGPVILASVEQTVATEHFELLPVSPTQLATGLLGAALVGPAAIATLLVFSIGTVGGYAAGFGSGLILLTIAMLATLLSVVVARLIVTWLSHLLQGSRSRQLVSVVLMGIIFLPSLAGSFVATVVAERGVGGAENLRVPGWVGWGYLFPPAGLGRGVEALDDRSWWALVAYVGYGVVWLGVMVWGWGRGLLRTQVVAPQAGRKVRTGSLRPRFVPLPQGPVGALAAKELASFRRDPRVRMQLGGASVAIVVILAANVFSADASILGDYLPFLSVMAGFVVATSFNFNLFGHDGGSFWGYAVVSSQPKSILAGKNLAWGIVAGVAVLMTAVAASIIGGSAIYLGPAMLAAWALLLVWAGVGDLVSIWGAFPLPEQSLYANRNMTGRTAVISILAVMVGGLAILPAAAGIFVAVWKGGPAWAWVAALIALLYGVGFYVVGLRLGSNLLAERMAALVDVLDVDD